MQRLHSSERPLEYVGVYFIFLLHRHAFGKNYLSQSFVGGAWELVEVFVMGGLIVRVSWTGMSVIGKKNFVIIVGTCLASHCLCLIEFTPEYG